MNKGARKLALPLSQALGAALVAVLAWAGPAQAYTPKVLRVGFVPSENLQNILKKTRPVIDALHRELKLQVVPFVATDYTGIIEAMRANKLDVAFFAPGAYVLAEKKANALVILKAQRKGKSFFYSSVITHRDSGIKRLTDLKGKTFAFVDPASTSGGVYPKVMFLNAGLNPDRDFTRVIYAGGHDAAVLAVLNKKVDAAATFSNDTRGEDSAWTQFLTKPGEAAAIQAIAFSKPIPSDLIAVHREMEAPLIQQVRKVFTGMSATPQGRKQLWDLYRIDAFVDSTPEDFEPVREAFSKVGLPIK
ncbi:MAG: phosphate/phosphite/phosphonate ABC transporter substrate-binding protein [Candidatus Sericytochromatia bacterium]|nr:phosphate/phosphite/phosphonate ABC transporter substrate-binding protein [Candidatus Sericytochromatia bacterium]